MKDDLKVKPNYSFWRHPIRWYTERKLYRFLNLYMNKQWREGLDKEVAKLHMDMVLYGGVCMKDGKRIDPEEFFCDLLKTKE